MVKDFKIVVNTPAYSGSEITGTLTVQVDEPKSYNYIKVSLNGRAHVHWTETRTTGSGNNRRTTTHSYTANEVCIDKTVVVWSKEQAPGRKLQPGVHNFPFRFQLPAELPSSFQDTVGSIRYHVQAKIGTGFLKQDHVIKPATIHVNGVVDINSPTLQAPMHFERQKTLGCFCCTSGPITYTVQVPRTGYCIGKNIPFSVTVENGSTRRIRLSASLVKSIQYYAQGHRRESTKTIASIARGPIQPRNTTSWAPRKGLKIPPTETTMTLCRIIKISYHLRLTVLIPRANNSSIDVPLTIGNVPLRTNQAIATVPSPLLIAPPSINFSPQASQPTGSPLPSAPPAASAGPLTPSVGWITDPPPSYEEVMKTTTN